MIIYSFIILFDYVNLLTIKSKINSLLLTFLLYKKVKKITMFFCDFFNFLYKKIKERQFCRSFSIVFALPKTENPTALDISLPFAVIYSYPQLLVVH